MRSTPNPPADRVTFELHCGVILPAMRLFLYGKTAAQWWAHARSFDRTSEAARFDASVLRDCIPTVKAIRYLAETFPFLDPPFHVLVPCREGRRVWPDVRVHVSSRFYDKGDFVRVADGVCAPVPELCFVQFACHAPLLCAIREGYALCGSYALDESSETGLVERFPLTSVEAMRRFAESRPGMQGAAKASRALSKVKSGSASPRETDLAMRLALPINLGGFGFSGARLNCRIVPSRRAAGFSDRDYFVGDLCWMEEKLVVEYDSNLHLAPWKLAQDAQKRSALEEDGFKVITVTNLQLDSPIEMERIAKQIARRLGRRLRIQVPDFARRQRELFNLRG